jgi:hypothetical protein
MQAQRHNHDEYLSSSTERNLGNNTEGALFIGAAASFAALQRCAQIALMQRYG